MSNDPLNRVMWELRIRHDTNDTFINIYIGAEKARLTQYYVNKKSYKASRLQTRARRSFLNSRDADETFHFRDPDVFEKVRIRPIKINSLRHPVTVTEH